MKCIFCGNTDSKVIDSRVSDDGNSIRRRRECIACGKRFTTYEKVEATPVLVIKSNGNRQSFDPEKIKAGLMKSCEKRPISIAQIDKIVENIERNIHNSLMQEVTSKQIGEMVMEELKNLDEVSYVRFASIHREFKDINTLYQEIERLFKDKNKDGQKGI